MNLLNDSADCHTQSNPLTKVLHSTSNNERFLSFQNKTRDVSFQKINTVHDESLQRDFNKFSNLSVHTQMKNDFLPQSFTVPSNISNQNVQFSNQQLNNQNTWINDFNRLEINKNHEYEMKNSSQIQNKNIPTIQQPNIQPRPYNSYKNTNIPTVYDTSLNQQQHIQSLGKNFEAQKHEDAKLTIQFDNAFDEIESEINTESSQSNAQQKQQQKKEEEEAAVVANLHEEEEKIKFAILAKNVFNTMNNTPKHISSNTSDKFKKSGFMQLMNKISNREVEISNDKKKLVDQSGNDILSPKIADPLKELTQELKSPFDSALDVSKNANIHINSNSWQSDFS